MLKDQKYSPKYWICHRPKSEEVKISTANVNILKSINLCMKQTGKDWMFLTDQGWSCDLMEINIVDMSR